MILLIIYWVLGYWATSHTIYRNYILIGDIKTIRIKKMIWGLFLGWLLIPWALIAKVLGYQFLCKYFIILKMETISHAIIQVRGTATKGSSFFVM